MGVENNIPEGWTESVLGDVMDIFSGKSRPKDNGIYPVYGGNGIHSYGDKYNQQNETLIIGRVGAYCGNVYKENNKFWLSDNALGVKSNEDSDLNYLYYKLKSMKLNNVSIGAAQPLLTQSLLKELEVIIPKKTSEQKAIAKVLTAFDDKIELLQAQNKTLENIAQTIFKEWFGKYQIGDELPDGWRVGEFGDIAKHVKNNIKPFENPNKLYHHYSLPAYDDGLRPVTESGSDIKSNKYSVEKNSFLVSKLNPFTPRIWTIFDSNDLNICSTEFQVVKPNEDNLFSIAHCLLNSKYFTSNLSQKVKGTSSSHQRVNPEDIFEVDLIIPNKEDLTRFEKLILPLITKKDINYNNIESLTKTRDTLLPKLMSGQVRVKNLEN